MKFLFSLTIVVLSCLPSFGQINAKLMRYVDVSETQICFVYGGDIWVMDKEGGMATQLTNSPGEETYPKFSPDGTEIAFTVSKGVKTGLHWLLIDAITLNCNERV